MRFSESNSVSNTLQKKAKIGQFGRRIERVFVDFKLKTQYSPHPEPAPSTRGNRPACCRQG